jgi:integrase
VLFCTEVGQIWISRGISAVAKKNQPGQGKKIQKGRVTSAKLETMTARAKLTWAPTPYFVVIDQGVELGYRKGKRTNDVNRKPGAWLIRRYQVEDRGYISESLDASADDFADSDGVQILTFWQAQDRVRAKMKGAAPAKTEQPPRTVGEAVAAYIVAREARSKANGRDARYRLSSVLTDKKLAARPLGKLTETDLKKWRSELPATQKPATIKRTANDFHAALSAAVDQDGRNLPDTIRTEIKVGLKSPPNSGGEARHALLTDADVRRIVDAAFEVDDDFGALVLVLAATGARFSQAAKINVSGLQTDSQRLVVPASVKGKTDKPRPNISVPVGSDVISRLKPIVAGRTGYERLLMRTDGRATKRETRAEWETASLIHRPWRKALTAAGVPYVEPYALRHSSIVRMLRKGLPVRIVAGLHDTSIAMIEKHYSAHILDMADELARQAIVSLTTAAPTPLRVAG